MIFRFYPPFVDLATKQGEIIKYEGLYGGGNTRGTPNKEVSPKSVCGWTKLSYRAMINDAEMFEMFNEEIPSRAERATMTLPELKAILISRSRPFVRFD